MLQEMVFFFYFPELNSLKTVLNRDTEKLGNSVGLTWLVSKGPQDGPRWPDSRVYDLKSHHLVNCITPYDHKFQNEIVSQHFLGGGFEAEIFINLFYKWMKLLFHTTSIRLEKQSHFCKLLNDMVKSLACAYTIMSNSLQPPGL